MDDALSYLQKTQFQIPLTIEFGKETTAASTTLKKTFKGYHPLLDWGELIKF